MTKVPSNFRAPDPAPSNKTDGVSGDGNPHQYGDVYTDEPRRMMDVDIAAIPPNLPQPTVQHTTQYANVPGKGRLKK